MNNRTKPVICIIYILLWNFIKRIDSEEDMDIFNFFQLLKNDEELNRINEEVTSNLDIFDILKYGDINNEDDSKPELNIVSVINNSVDTEIIQLPNKLPNQLSKFSGNNQDKINLPKERNQSNSQKENVVTNNSYTNISTLFETENSKSRDNIISTNEIPDVDQLTGKKTLDAKSIHSLISRINQETNVNKSVILIGDNYDSIDEDLNTNSVKKIPYNKTVEQSWETSNDSNVHLSRDQRNEIDASRFLTDYELIHLLKYCVFTNPYETQPLVELTWKRFSECLTILLDFYRLFGRYHVIHK